jgi:hypothetical protein
VCYLNNVNLKIGNRRDTEYISAYLTIPFVRFFSYFLKLVLSEAFLVPTLPKWAHALILARLYSLTWLHFKHSRNYMFVLSEIHIWVWECHKVMMLNSCSFEQRIVLKPCKQLRVLLSHLVNITCQRISHTCIELNKLKLSEKLLWPTLSGICFTVEGLSVYIRFSII